MKDLIIIGAGPAGLSAAIYGVRAGLDISVMEKFSPGGQVINTYEIENYPGFAEPVTGWELMSAMENQVKRLGVEILNGEAVSVEKGSDNIFSVSLSGKEMLRSRAVIAATGGRHKKLGVPGEEEFYGKGVSNCATCDGAFYKEKVTAVVGGGDTALEEAIFLTRFSSKVYLIHRRDRFRAAKILQDRVLSNKKIVPLYDTVVKSINGKNGVEGVTVTGKKTGKDSEIQCHGVFIFTGWDLNTGYLPKEVINGRGEVIIDSHAATPVPGLFAAGDIREGSRRQIVTACADGATAALSAYDYISGQ
ncbi:MAG: thioredoxin-disulfide reductase [Spirochaetes bacterium]|nr:thioredoxin-disulfide reductase [Spirochaetota bacterium]